MIVECGICGNGVEETEAALAFNIGAGPEYYCAECVPPGSTAQTVKLIRTFMGNDHE